MRHKLQRAGVVEAIAGGVRRGLTVEAACALAGVHRSTLHRWRKADAMSDESGTLERVQVAVAEALAANQNELVEVAHVLGRPDAFGDRLLDVDAGSLRHDGAEGENRRDGDVVERLGEAPIAYSVSVDGEQRLLTPAEAFAEDASLAELGA